MQPEASPQELNLPLPSTGRFCFVVVFVRGRFGGAQRPPKGIVSVSELGRLEEALRWFFLLCDDPGYRRLFL